MIPEQFKRVFPFYSMYHLKLPMPHLDCWSSFIVLVPFCSISAIVDHQSILLHTKIYEILSFLYQTATDIGKYFRLDTYYLYNRNFWKYLSHKRVSVFAENWKLNPRWFVHYDLLSTEKFNAEIGRSFIIYIYFQC